MENEGGGKKLTFQRDSLERGETGGKLKKVSLVQCCKCTDLLAEVEPELVEGEAVGAAEVVDAAVHILEAEDVADLGNQDLKTKQRDGMRSVR